MTDHHDIQAPEGILIGADNEEAGKIAAELIVGTARDAVKKRGVFHFALSGGSTPQFTYSFLAETPYTDRMPWWAANIHWGDERCVPPDDPESNFRLANDTFLNKVGLMPTQIHRIPADSPDIQAALKEASRGIPASFDLILLGVGDDGHTASLFPGSPALNETDKKFVQVTGPKPPNPRVTITPPVIYAARRIIVIVTGSNKAEIVRQALEGDVNINKIPAQIARRGIWVLDEASAHLLTKR